MNVTLYLFASLGVLISITIPILRALLPTPQIRTLDPKSSFLGGSQILFYCRIIFLDFWHWIYAGFRKEITTKADILADYACNSTLQKLRGGNRKSFKNNNMKYLLFFTFISSCSFLSAQDLILDARTMTLNDLNTKFKVGELIHFQIDYVTPPDSFVLEISSNDILNEIGFNKFTEANKSNGIRGGSGTTYHFLSFKVENVDYTKLKLIRLRNGVKIEERIYKYGNRGGVKFDISSGFFATPLKDSVYALQYISDSTQRIVPDAIGEMRVGIGLLAHLHTRFKYPFNLGLCLGFEVDSDVKVSYLSGLSFLIGRDRKFIINGGIALSRVDVLSRIYQENEIVPSTISSVPTVKIWEAGWFWGVTYNF